MKFTLLAATAALALTAVPAYAQENTSISGAGAEANSGSASQSNGNEQGQSQANIGGNNAGIGSSTSESNSGAVAITESTSGSASNSDQDQGQSQGQSSSNTNSLGQQASNQQGVTVNQQWNSTNRKVTEFRTNSAVPLAASSSFSSDYCGGTASGGASIAPFGVSIGGAGPTFDKSCQSLRRAEKFGMAAANAHNMQQPELAQKLMTMMIWSICTSDSKGTKADADTAQACSMAGLLGSQASPPTPTPHYAPEPATQSSDGHPTPEAVERYKTPRGDLEFQSVPVIQDVPVAAFAASGPRMP